MEGNLAEEKRGKITMEQISRGAMLNKNHPVTVESAGEAKKTISITKEKESEIIGWRI